MEEDGAVRDSSSPILAQSGFTLRSDSEHSGKDQRRSDGGREGLGKQDMGMWLLGTTGGRQIQELLRVESLC